MSKVVIYKKFLTFTECDEILKFAKCNFDIDKRTYAGWHAKSNKSFLFEEKIHNLLTPISPFTSFYSFWINLTEYENGRKLDLHKDEQSDRTFTVVLTDRFTGGDFIVENKTYKLSKGDCIAFDGFNCAHGVTPVTEGYRASLNIWIKEGKKAVL